MTWSWLGAGHDRNQLLPDRDTVPDAELLNVLSAFWQADGSMNQQHRPWKPPTAAKPSHLASVGASKPSTSLAALQGATTAFTNPKTNPPVVQQLRRQYEPAHGSGSSENTRGRVGKEHDVTADKSQAQRSPSRGRHLAPEHARLAGARTAVSSTNLPVPGSLDRTPSMVAARLVSASPSPARSNAGVSPPTEPRTANNNLQQAGNSGLSDKNNGKPAPVAQQLSPNSAASRQTPVKSLSLDKIPRLPPKSAAVAARESSQSHGKGSEGPKPNTSRVTGSLAIPIPLKRANTQTNDLLTSSRPTQSDNGQFRTEKYKPPAPAPRKGRPMARSPLQADLTGPRQNQGLSREETISRMADAMVASSLAASRTPSPTKALQSRRRSASAHNLRHLPPGEQYVPPVPSKPQRPMKQTLRKASPEDEEDGLDVAKRGRRHLVRKHPNMHSEGDRKRWRDKVTEAERRRYEGVFAANRGLLLKSVDPKASPSRLVDPSSETNQVVNVIVRDIWDRSRLPEQVLEQIYDLVAPEDALVLNREQFVVGLWLIDQKLRGRKLPVKVSESVWSSVRHSQGIKVGRRG
ncbi:Increased rDNA silencing protein [Knufia fluminis]|uniref:Increased rDNA silencing protein n=1 Tax=Knufia fluminis TaxID=191047 RepID=A0AAN8EGV2_9EURO|nr:Increased rDNA silencing protein [Knufia fluminis]